MFNDTGSTIYIILLVALAPFSLGGVIFVIWWFTHSHEHEKPHTDHIEAIWNRRAEWGEETCRQIIAGQISPGMTSDMVRLAWPEPIRIETLSPQTERWHYQTTHKDTPSPFVIFEKGLVIESFGNGAAPSTTEFPMRVVVTLLGFLLLMVISIIFGVIMYE